MGPEGSTVEQLIAQIGSRAHGVVTRAELMAAGITPREIKRRATRGTLIPIHRGVFRVGHLAPSTQAVYMAAVKACGKRAVLAGRAAGHVLGVLKRKPPRIEVIAPTYRRVARVVTRRDRLAPGETTRWRGIPVTSVPRTIVDLAAALPEDELARAFHEAAVRHRTTPAQVERVLARRRNWPGARKLRRVLRGDVPVTLSRLEKRFLARLRATRLPQPEVNRRVDGRYVDCRWPDHRLTVELDSYRYHHTRHAWEEDRRRERAARARGDEFRRYTWLDVVEDPEPMLADLRELLAASRAGRKWPAPKRAAS
jgi:very-short-patch-repair endonuclease